MKMTHPNNSLRLRYRSYLACLYASTRGTLSAKNNGVFTGMVVREINHPDDYFEQLMEVYLLNYSPLNSFMYKCVKLPS